MKEKPNFLVQQMAAADTRLPIQASGVHRYRSPLRWL
jgi:hypothetical protein